MEKLKEQALLFFENYGVKILAAIGIMVVGLILVKFMCKGLKTFLKRSRLDPICHKFFLSLTKISLYAIVGIISLSIIGVPMTSLITILGAAGLAIGLAVQDSLSNLAGGFILLFSKPFNVGDFIDVSGVTGTVRHINILQTKLLTVDNKAIIIPNGQVSSAKIINYSAEALRRLDLVFAVSYRDNITQVKQLLNDIVTRHPLSVLEPEPIIRICEHAESSIRVAVKVWVKTDNYWALNYDLLEEVKLVFDKQGITIPFNQVDVNIVATNNTQTD